LTEYRASTLSDILSAKKFIEAIVNSIDDPVIGLNMEREILFINEEALNVIRHFPEFLVSTHIQTLLIVMIGYFKNTFFQFFYRFA